MWQFPLQNYNLDVPAESWHPGTFGFKRKFDYHHTGVDLYAKEGDSVFAVEDGIIVAIEDFTGEINGTPWWNNTWAILIEGESGVAVYGEVLPFSNDIVVGARVSKGQQIATVLTVLKELEIKSWIPGHSRSMLHFELHMPETRETVWWKLNEPQPPTLLNPTNQLTEAKNNVSTI